jgi:long-subunit fatty acid transport protein
MQDRLYFGASIGINRVFFEQDVRHTESDANNQIPVFNRFVYTEYLKTRGTGFNAKVGIIARPVDALRIGASYHIPTFYNLNDVYTTDIESYFDQGYDYNESASSPFGEYDYDLRTPGKFVGSMTLTFGQIAMLSADYEYIDYTKSRLDAPDYDFYDENQEIQNGYQATHNIRVGGELKFGLAYLRGGYAFYQSPYNFSAPVNPNRNVFSGGAGLRTKNFFFDLAFSHAKQESLYYPYVPMVNGADLDSKMNTMVMTLGFRF